jgi:chromosome segregation ATPase
MNATKPDQSDILAQNAQLTADLATAKQTIGSLQTQISALATERDNLSAEKAKFTGELSAATSEHERLKTENDSLKAEKQTLDKAIATKLAALGITEKALETPKLDSNRKLTATEACSAVKGGAAVDAVMHSLTKN